MRQRGAPPEFMTIAKYIPGGDCIVYTCFGIHNEAVVPLFHHYVSANVLGMQYPSLQLLTLCLHQPRFRLHLSFPIHDQPRPMKPSYSASFICELRQRSGRSRVAGPAITPKNLSAGYPEHFKKTRVEQSENENPPLTEFCQSEIM